MPWPARTDDVAKLPDSGAEHMPAEEERRRESLVLRERADLLVDRQTGEEGVDLGLKRGRLLHG